jgi:gliding motility-associated-like protein
MRFKLLLVLLAFTAFNSFAQDFSNKGKEFWLAYSYHVGMMGGGAPTMTLYLTSDVNTNYTVEIFGVTTLATGNINANQVINLNIPTAYFINNEGLFTNRAIRVTSAEPIVVYSYITRSAASGATLCLPVNVLGREYISANFTQLSNENNSNSYITIVAVEDNTTVEITPAGATKNGWVAGQTYTVSLNKGQIYQVLGALNANNNLAGVDLTGSRVRSIASTTGGCKRIAVFSGSGKIRIPATNCSNNSSDNLYQQLYPTGTWGKKYLTVPSRNNPFNYYRIIKNDPTASVYVNGILVPPASFVNNVFYTFFNNIPNLIESDQPISVVQYFTTQNCDGNLGQPNDPDMIVLNPVEQNIDKVTLVNSNLFAASTANFPHQHHIHVIMKNGGTGMSSFKFDGAAVPVANWIPHPSEPSYSYLYLANVTQGNHRIESDSGFNALAYGYANAESYGYSAGANVKDLYQFVSIQNQYASVPFPATCKNAPFFFAMVFPYQPSQIQWLFNGLFPDVTVPNPVFDSTWTLSGKQLYRYKITAPYSIATVGTYPIRVLAQNPTSDGCSGEQEINYELQVYERPTANFNFSSTGCITDSVYFTDISNTNGRNAIEWNYNFGDNNAVNLKNPVHLYTTPGTFDVKYSVVTDIGCLSDTITKTITIAPQPTANFGVSAPTCVNRSITITDSSTVASSVITKWYWNFGDGSPQVVATSNLPQIKTYTSTGSFTITLKVETATGCQSTVFSRNITIAPLPVAEFSFGNACLPSASMSFTNNSTIPGGNASQMSYSWDFGNNTNSQLQDPVAVYTAVGPYQVKLVVTSPAGCADSITKTVNTIYAQPQAQISSPDEVCLGTSASFIDQSTAPSSTITQWLWDFGNGQTSTAKDPVHTYSLAGTYTVSLTATSAIGCVSQVVTKNIIVNPLPIASFSFSSPQCAGGLITFTDNSTANAGNIITWTWNMGDGSAAVVRNSNAPFTHSYPSAGNYTVTLFVETNKGCISPVKTEVIMIHPLPVPGFILPDNCLNDPFSQFIDTSTIANGTASQFTYLWNFGDPNSTPSNPNTSTLKDPKHKYSVVGAYNVTLTVTSAQGCVATVSQAFFVNGTQPVSAFNINGGDQQCSNRQVSITNSSTVDVGKISKLTIQWDYVNTPANEVTINLPVPGAVYNFTYPEFFTPATRNYTIRVVAYSGDSCFNESTRIITMKATPDISFNALPSVCADRSSFLLTQAIVTNIPGSGVYSGPGIVAGSRFDPSVAGVGNKTIRYTFTGTNGCTNFKEQNITVFPVPVVNAGPDRFVLEGGNAVLEATASGNNLVYSWSPATYLNEPADARPVTTPLDDITYTLVVTSQDGCSASDAVFVKVLKAPAIPNVFTPNKDGVNDTWQIQYLESYPGATIDVFNRYGQKVFNSVGYNTPWDGSFKGNPLPAGTYYYIINPKNGRKQLSGFVDIVR